MPAIKTSKEDSDFIANALLYCIGVGAYQKTSDMKKAKMLADRHLRAMRSIKPRSAKNKGASWQKEVAEEISLITEVPFDNQDDQSEILCRTMGCSGNDIILRGKALERFTFGIEAKNQNNISMPDWCKQAKANEIDGRWMLFIKSALLEEPIVAFPMRLLREYFKKEFGRF